MSDKDARVRHISGFTGIQGVALILNDEAILWTSSSYYLQAKQQVFDNWKVKLIGTDQTVTEYLNSTLSSKDGSDEENKIVVIDSQLNPHSCFLTRHLHAIHN